MGQLDMGVVERKLSIADLFAISNRMKSFNLCIVAVFLSAVVNGYTDECPIYDVDYDGIGIDYIGEIPSWEECGYLCHLTNGCNYWTWRNYGDNSCFLKSEKADIPTKYTNAISGSKNCYH